MEKFRHRHGSSPNVSFWASPAGDKNKVDNDNNINWVLSVKMSLSASVIVLSVSLSLIVLPVLIKYFQNIMPKHFKFKLSFKNINSVTQ